MTRHLVKLAPSVASASQRASQLVVLWALTAGAGGATQAQLVTGFGLIATFVMISDSGAGNFLLARTDEELTGTAYARALGVHTAVSLAGVGACAAYLLAILERPVAGATVAVLVALALTQLEDNLSRVVRYPLLNRSRELAFAWPELVCSVAKIAVSGYAGLTGHLLALLALPAISALVLVFAVRPVRQVLHRGPAEPPAVRAILTFGLAGAINATYSQLPLIVSGVLLSNASTAVLATFLRVFQALEIVPGTVALQLIPRYARGRRPVARDWLAMTGGAVLIAGCFLPLVPLVGRLLDLPLGIGLAVLFAGAFVARCGGYVLSSFLMGTGRVDLRLRLTALAALVMLPVVPLTVATLGRPGGALSALASEVLLAGVFALALRRAGDVDRPASHQPEIDQAADPALPGPVTS